MAEKVRLQKTVRDKSNLVKVVAKEFTTFVQPDTLPDNDTVTELFRLYDKLYLEIPLEGPQSHTYLIEQSSKLISVVDDTQDIQPLLDEIADLRQRLLDANERNNELENQISNG